VSHNHIIGGDVYYCQPRRRDTAPVVKCDYCGRYGPLGICEGCGAPTRPEPSARWITSSENITEMQIIEKTHLRSPDGVRETYVTLPPRQPDRYR
jgi:hypothetical protein